MAVQNDVPAWKRYAAEFVGTFFLVLAGTGALLATQAADGHASPIVVAAAFGVALMVGVYALGHVSGAHFNPAVTIAFSASRDFPRQQILGYIGAQLGGSVLASLLLWAMFGARLSHLGATTPQIGRGEAFIAEIVLSFVLMFVIEAVATDTRAVGAMAGLAAGGALLLGVLIGFPISGGSLNPARSFGPALVSGTWNGFWIYVAGPIIGATAGALAYRYLRTPATVPVARKTERVTGADYAPGDDGIKVPT